MSSGPTGWQRYVVEYLGPHNQRIIDIPNINTIVDITTIITELYCRAHCSDISDPQTLTLTPPSIPTTGFLAVPPFCPGCRLTPSQSNPHFLL